MIRENSKDSYTISKWDGGAMPISTYTLRIDEKKRVWCTCPSGTYRHYCKHVKMLRLWIGSGKPIGELYG